MNLLIPVFENRLVATLLKCSPKLVYLFFGKKIFLPSTLFWKSVLSKSALPILMDNCNKFLFGWKLLNIKEKAIAYQHLYSYTSVKVIVHWFQIMRSKRFQMYDEEYAKTGHMVFRYPISQITCPISLFSGTKDNLSDLKYTSRHGPKSMKIHEVEKYEHLDFLWAHDVHKTVFPTIFAILDQIDK